MSAFEKAGYTKFGKLIKKKLIDRNMTATQLADTLGTTPQYLNKILHGERSGEKYIQAISEILNIETEWYKGETIVAKEEVRGNYEKSTHMGRRNRIRFKTKHDDRADIPEAIFAAWLCICETVIL